jgi:uncharacterized membrane protein YhhN
MFVLVATALALGSATLQIRAEYHGPRSHVYLFKPITMLLILLIALSGLKAPVSVRGGAIIVGLAFCLAGDVLLMLPSDRFVAGLASFLVGHLAYTVAFTAGSGFSFSLRSLLPLAIYGAAIYTLLAPHLGKMRSPVLAYVVVILIMGWQAWERWNRVGAGGDLLAFLGALFFIFSDSVLALDRFRAEFKSARLLSLTSYFCAQWLIASSVGQDLQF